MPKDVDNLLFYSHVLNTIDDSIIVTDFKGKILFWSKSAVKTFGYKKSEVVGKSVSILYDKTNKTNFQKGLQRVSSGKEYSGKFIARKKDGSSFLVRIKATIVKDSKKLPIGLIGIFKNITKEKVTKEREISYQKKIQRFLTHSTEVLQLLDATGKIIYTTGSLKKMVGYAPKELIGQNPFQFMHPEDVSMVQKKFIKLLRMPGGYIVGRYRVKRKNGSWLWIETTATNMLADPSVQAIVANIRSIHLYKSTEEKLFEQARLLDVAHDAFIVMDEKNNITFWNKGAKKLYGYTAEEAVGKKGYKLLKTKFPISRHDLISLLKKSQTWRGELEHTTKKGKKIIVESVWEALRKDHQFSILEVNRDITLQKKALQEIEDTRNQLQVTFENMTDGISVFSPEGQLLYANNRYLHTLGFKSYKSIRKNSSLQEIRESCAKRFVFSDENGNTIDLAKSSQTPYERSLSGEKDSQAVLHFFNKRTKKGQWILIKAKQIYSKKDNIQYIVQIFTDITDLKNASDSIYFLSEAGRILSSSLNYHTTINSVVSLAVPKIADWCTVDMLNKHGGVDLLAVAHKDKKKIKWAYDLRKKYPVNMNENTGLAKVLKTGKSEFYPLITEEMINSSTNDPKILKLIKRIGFSALIIVPIIVKGSILGALQFVSTESKRQYKDIDFQMAEQLASRVSVAIENSLLYEDSQRERERLKSMVSNVPGVVWEAWGKPDAFMQRIDFVNDYVETMLGYTVEEWLTTPNFWLKIVHPEDRKHASEETSAFFMNGKGGISRFRWQKKDGSYIWVEARNYIIKNEKGQPIGIRGVTMDISNSIELERRKDDFISMASHELKTPLTSAGVFAQILSKRFEKKGDVESKAILDKMNGSLDKLTQLVRELLDVTKIERGKLEFKKESFLVADLVKNIAENLQHLTDHIIEIDWQTRELVFADKDRVDQVLTNLITNAIKYSPEGKRVVIRSRKRKDTIVVSVQDFGIGIPKEQQEKIFDRFYQANETSKGGTYPGLGLGLYISSEIIKSHGGNMWVESEEGKGSTFFFSLPIYNKSKVVELEIPS